MRWPVAVVFAAFCSMFALAGCSTHPIIDDVTRVSTYDVVEQIRCEAGRAVREFAPAYVQAAIAYEFNFNITEINNANAAATMLLPFVGGGMFQVDLAKPTQVTRSREAVRNFRIVDSFTDAKNAECFAETPRRNIVYPISGDIGAYELVKTFIQLAKASTYDFADPGQVSGVFKPKLTPPKGEIFVYADTLTFTTTLGSSFAAPGTPGSPFGSVGAHPVLILNPVSGKARITNASGNFTVQRQDMHEVTIAISAAKLDPGQHPVVRSFAVVTEVPGVGFTNNSLLAATLIQGQSTPEKKALLELDRQRILRLQRDVPNLLVGP